MKDYRVEYKKLNSDGTVYDNFCSATLRLEGGMESEAIFELKKRDSRFGYVIMKITPF